MNSRIRARRSALLFAALLTVVSCFAPSALAADVASVTIGDGVVRYEGTPGNDELRLGYLDGKVTFGQITGARITAGPGCELDERYSYASCRLPESTKVIVDFGAGDDQLEGNARDARQPLEVHGGEGHDDLVGNPGNDVLIGGPGADRMRGEEGDDVLDYQDGGPDGYQGDCGEGHDVLRVDSKGVDLERYSDGCETIDAARALGGTAIGGFDDARVRFIPEPGIDHDLVVAAEARGLRMTDPAGIDAGVGCVRDRPGDATTVFCAGTGDAYATDIELGDGNDRLRVVGDPFTGERPNLVGGHGNDTILGGPEGAVIKGGAGDDVISGGAGIDRIEGDDGADRIDGGPDRDEVFGGAGADQIDTRDGSFSTGRASVIGEAPACGAGRDVLTADVGDLPGHDCEKLAKKETSPAASGTLQILGGSTLRMSNEKTPSLRIKVRCVGGPCAGRAYLFGDRRYIAPFNATKGAFKLEAGQTAIGVMRFGSGYGAFRSYVGKKGRLRMYVATLAGDAEGRTSTVRRTVTVTARRGLR